MRRFVPAALLPFLCLSVHAEDGDEALQKKVADYIEESVGGQDWGKRQKLAGAIRRTPGGPAAFLKHCLERKDLEEKGWQLSSAGAVVFDIRPDEAARILKPALGGKDPQKVLFALQIVDGTGLGAVLLDDLIALWGSRDQSISWSAQSILQSVKSPVMIDRMIEEAGKPGERGTKALQVLAGGQTARARVFLRALAVSETESADRRALAMSGLAQRAGREEIAIAVAALGSTEEALVDAAIHILTEARAVVDPALLRPLLKSGDWREPVLLKLLSLAGDEAAAKKCLTKARGGQNWDKADWYAWAGRSRVASIGPALEKAFGEETDDGVRMGILRGMGELGNPAAMDLILKYLTHPEQGSAALGALAALGRTSPDCLDTLLDRLTELVGVSNTGLESFHYSFMERQNTQDRVTLIDAYIRLADRHSGRRRIREIVCSALSDLCRPDLGHSEESVEGWKAWWGAHREKLETVAPKRD